MNIIDCKIKDDGVLGCNVRNMSLCVHVYWMIEEVWMWLCVRLSVCLIYVSAVESVTMNLPMGQ